MARRRNKERSFLLPLGILLLPGFFLGVRTYQGVSAVQQAQRSTPPEAHVPSAEGRLLGQLAAKDSALASAVPSERDPFRDPPPPRRLARETPAPPVPPEEPQAQPTLRALLFDSVEPTVQITVGGATSDWLRKGEQFRGWTVVAIDPASVTLSREGEIIVLP